MPADRALLRRLALSLSLVLCLTRAALAAEPPFPTFSSIQDNVTFWKRVYAEHPSSQGLLHDSQNLAIVYEVIPLAGEDTPGCAQTNEGKIEAAKEKYRSILAAWAQGQPPANPEARRVAALFGPTPRAETLNAAAEHLRCQRCLSDRFRAGLIRSGRYLTAIKGIFKQYGLPEDLAFLPHVESSYDAEARSKAGALGLWQLMPDTGARFLTINAALDERRDPLLATRAAAKLLQGNHNKLETWPLALTAYNHGLTAVLRAKNSLGTYERILQSYDGPHFGFASRNFYAEFLAAREIASNYRHYFPDLHLTPPLAFKETALKKPSTINEVSRQFRVDQSTLATLNPALLKPVWDGKRPIPPDYPLRLPRNTRL